MTPDEDDDGGQRAYASPACFLHELDPSYLGLPAGADATRPAEVMAWRKAERERLITQRLAIDPRERSAHAERIAAALDRAIGEPSGLTVSAYWPIRAEPDLRPWLELLAARGGRGALPVVVEKRAPLIFRAWRQGERLQPGVWNIPVPVDGEEVVPEVVIAPLVGFDRDCYRLGYGGGFFDRTLAALAKRPLVIGVGYAQAAIATIHPLPHDIAMDLIVTEVATYRRDCRPAR